MTSLTEDARGNFCQKGRGLVWVVGWSGQRSAVVMTRDKKGRDWKFEKIWVTIDSTYTRQASNRRYYVTKVETNKKLIWKYVGCVSYRLVSYPILSGLTELVRDGHRVSVLLVAWRGLVYSTKIQGQWTSHPHYVCLSVSGQSPFYFHHSMLLGPNEIVAPTNYLSINNDRHSTELKFNWNNKATLNTCWKSDKSYLYLIH